MTPEPILIVDDDAGTRSLLTELLEASGYATVEADDGEVAVAAAEARRPQLVLLDVRLPRMSGLDVCRKLRHRYGQHLPIILVSGEAIAPGERAEGLGIGADDYVTKPFFPAELLARVRRQLVRARAADAGDGDGDDDVSALTRREAEVLGLLASGHSQRAIAADLKISSKTVATHIQRILAKLGVHSRAAAVARAYRLGLVRAVPERLAS
jgi:DNA-binding NarL/FixJ family response regulator